MTTRETIEAYFNHLGRGGEWQVFLSDGLEFTSFGHPVKKVGGKDAFLEATKRFYSMIHTVQVRDLLVAGDQACGLTRYELNAPDGRTFSSDVAEIFMVRDGKIASFSIYFDSAPYAPPVPPAT